MITFNLVLTALGALAAITGWIVEPVKPERARLIWSVSAGLLMFPLFLVAALSINLTQ